MSETTANTEKDPGNKRITIKIDSDPRNSMITEPVGRKVMACLLAMPAVLLAVTTVRYYFHPTLQVKNCGPAPCPMGAESMVIPFHGAPWEKLLLLIPAIVIIAVAGIAARALFRIEVNMAAHQRPFTKRDGRVLGISAVLLFLGTFFADLLCMWIPRLLPGTEGMKSPEIVGLFTESSLYTWLLVLFVGQMWRIHTMARQAWDKLEEVA